MSDETGHLSARPKVQTITPAGSQPVTSTPKPDPKLQATHPPTESPVNLVDKPKLQADKSISASRLVINKPSPSKVSSGSSKSVKPDKPDPKRRREDTASFSGDNTSGASMLVDRDEITVKHDDLKRLIDSAVKDAISAAMVVVSTRLEASLKNIFTERFDHLEGRVFDVEQTLDRDLKKANEILEQHKSSTARTLRDNDSRILNNERYIYQNESEIEDLKFQINNLEQYTRRNSIRIHGMREQGRGRNVENTHSMVADFLYYDLGLEPDIEIAHRIGVKSRDPNKPRTIIVKFVRRSDKLDVMLRRKSLKGKGISISDDLTVKNVKLINEVRDHERIEAAWSWDGKVYAKGKNGHKLKLYPGIQVDNELDRVEAQANARANEQDNNRSNVRSSANASGVD